MKPILRPLEYYGSVKETVMNEVFGMADDADRTDRIRHSRRYTRIKRIHRGLDNGNLLGLHADAHELWLGSDSDTAEAASYDSRECLADAIGAMAFMNPDRAYVLYGQALTEAQSLGEYTRGVVIRDLLFLTWQKQYQTLGLWSLALEQPDDTAEIAERQAMLIVTDRSDFGVDERLKAQLELML